MSYIAAIKLAGQYQQFVGKNFRHCLICSPGLRVEGGHFQHLLVTRGKLCIIYFGKCKAVKLAIRFSTEFVEAREGSFVTLWVSDTKLA